MSTPAEMDVKKRIAVDSKLAALPWLALGLSLLLAVIFFGNVTLAGIAIALKSVPVWIYAPIALAQAAVIMLAALKWHLIMGATAGNENGLHPRDAVAATTLGALAGQVLPIQLSTPAARAWIARRHDVSALRVVGTSIFEQVFEILVLMSMGIVAVAAQILAVKTGTAVAVALVSMIVLTTTVRPALRFADAGTQLVAIWFPRALPKFISAMADGFRKTAALRYRLLLQLTGLSFARYVLMAALNVGVLHLLVPEVSAVTLLIAYPVVILLMSLPIFPGGLGVVELTWAGVLISQGADVGPAAEVAITLRIVTTFGFLLVAPVLLALITPAREKS